MRWISSVLLVSGLLVGAMACGGASDSESTDLGLEADGGADTTVPEDNGSPPPQDDTTEPPPSPFSAAPADPVDYSGGACPTLEAGTNIITSNGQSRTVEISLPADPTNAPVLFLFHGLGDNPKNMMSYFGAQAASANEGAIVVAPKSCCGFVEWPFISFEDPTPDVTLFDDLVTCLDEQFDIDNRRVFATGFSAGALWTTYLATRRADYLAAVATLSGGVGTGVSYVKPTYNMPALVSWGGANDSYNAGVLIIYFETESTTFANNLESEGHYVARCNHGTGHTVPWGAADWVKRFLFDQVWNDGSTPYEEQVPSGVFPDYCVFP